MLKSLYHNNKTFTLGILGGGQLAKMIASAAYRMGLNVAIIENHSNSPAGDMTKNDFVNGWTIKDDLDRFIEISDIITLENEFIDPAILRYISNKRLVYPSPDTMQLIQDKYSQKSTFADNHLPVPIFREINSAEDGITFGREFGFPFILKTRKYGYDGYGNATVIDQTTAVSAFEKFKNKDSSILLMAESFVDFDKELAVMIARNQNGDIVVYPTVETIQKNHICHEVIAPAMIDANLRLQAQNLAIEAVKSINGVGMFGVELFLRKGGNILINEIAPRPHNSGHYTIEACYTSQFENTIRAVCNLPLGSGELICGGAAMINLLGERDGLGVPKDVSQILKYPTVSLHLYNKKQSRIGRKMGHITAVSQSTHEAHNIAKLAADSIVW